MPTLAEQSFRVGKWRVEPSLSLVSSDSSSIHLEPKLMAVLVCLAEHAGAMVSKEELISTVWPDTFVSDQVLTHAIWQLRKVLGNGARSEVIETIPKRGYRLVVHVEADITSRRDVAPAAALRNGAAPTVSTQGLTLPRRRLVIGSSVVALLALLLGVWAALPWRAPAAKPTVAVLPLENFSGDPEQEYFAEGMTEELTTSLAKISGLRVISRSSMMAYRGSRQSLPTIARELQVDAVVEGSVQRSGNRVRITAQLIDAHNQQHLWAETFDRDFEDVLAIRDDVARAIAAEVNIKLTPQERRVLASSHAVAPQAYEAYLMGRYFAGRHTREDYEKSIEYFQDAIRHDPSYALAYAEMAESYAMLDFTADLRGENFRKAEQAAEQASRLDPDPAEVRIRMADLKMFWDWDWSQCDSSFRQAARLNPGSADAQGHFAVCLHILGRYDEALEEQERARQLDPLSPWAHRWLGQLRYNVGQYQPAVKWFRQAIELDPKDAGAHEALAIVYDALRQDENAVSERISAEVLRGGSPAEVAELRKAFTTGGVKAFRTRYQDSKRQAINKLVEAARQQWVPPVRIAALCVAAGDPDAAFQWLDKAYEHHSPQLIWLKSSIHFAALRSDPRFTALLLRMNFPDSKR